MPEKHRLTRRDFLKSGTAALAVGLGGIGMVGTLIEAEASAMISHDQEDKPNFVIIYTDDHGYGDLGCYGADDLLTPNMDKLADSGVRFTNWYANAPICSASRASLMTGRYPIRAGIPGNVSGKRGSEGLPVDEITIAKALKGKGYRTAVFGKWHLGTGEKHRPKAHGFDEHYGFLAGCVDYYSHIYYWEQGSGVDPVHDLWHNDEEQWENGRYLTELITEKAVDFIKRQDEAPFFMYVPYNAPHYPMHAPQKYLDRFPNLPPDRRIMAAMIAAADDGIGEIIKALKRSGKYENTVIFFAGDNGPSDETRNWLDGTTDPYTGGDTGGLRGHKGSLFEGGIKVPAMLSWPGHIPAHQVCDKMGVTMDILPTFMEIAGVRLPRGHKIDGTSILPMVTDGAQSPHKRMFWEFVGNTAVRDGDWKLILDGNQNPTSLFNMASDPDETTDLRMSEPSRVAELTQAIKEWLADVRSG